MSSASTITYSKWYVKLWPKYSWMTNMDGLCNLHVQNLVVAGVIRDAQLGVILQQCNWQLFPSDRIKIRSIMVIKWNDPFWTIRGLDAKTRGPLNITSCKDLYQIANLTMAQGFWRLIGYSFLPTRCARFYVGYILDTTYYTSNTRCINNLLRLWQRLFELVCFGACKLFIGFDRRHSIHVVFGWSTYYCHRKSFIVPRGSLSITSCFLSGPWFWVITT